MLTGVIFGAIVVVWLIILVPQFLGQRDHGSRLDDETIDRFAGSMRMVRRGGEQDPEFLTDSGARVSTPHTRRAAQHDLRQASQISMRRRRLGLLVHLGLLVAGIIVPFVAPVSHWWTALPVGLLAGWLVLSRISVVTVNRMLAAERAELQFGDEEPTVVISESAQDETVSLTEIERSVEISGPIGETLGSLWDPIPVTPTTYVSRPLLPRSVRTIDLSAPVASSELQVPVTAEKPTQDEGPGHKELPRAVGE